MKIRLDSKEQKELVLKNQGLVRHIAGKYATSQIDFEEYVSVGRIGLMKAAVTFDKSKEINFATYACRCITNEIFMYLRKEKSRKIEVSLDEPIDDDGEDNEITLLDLIPSPDRSFVEEYEQKEIVIKYISIILNFLEPRERFIMLYRIADIQQDLVAEALNISQSYISRLEKKLRDKVKSHDTISQQYKEVFTMAIIGDFYRIGFSSKDVKNFNLIFATFLQNRTSAEDLPDFKVVCNKERIIIQVPAHPESFSFIAQIIRQIDDYTITFVSDKKVSSEENNVLKEEKSDENNNTMEEKETMQTVEAETEVSEETETVEAETEVSEETETVEADAEVSEESEIEEPEQIISDNLSTSIEVDKSPLPNENSTVRKGSKVKEVREYMLTLETFTVEELKRHFPNDKTATIANALQLAKNKGLIASVGKGKYVTKKVSEATVVEEPEQIISDNLSTSIEVDKSPLPNENSTVRKGSKVKKVREYMLTLETFTVEELKQHFPDETSGTIANALQLAKNKGLIASVGKGKYVTKKD